MLFSLSDTQHARMLPSQNEMQSFDMKTIAALGSSDELMERAGLEIFREIKERFSFDLYSNGRVVVLAGPGNNGGDGFVIARHLKDHGYEVNVILAASSNYSAELLRQLKLFLGKEGTVFQFPESTAGIDGGPLVPISSTDLQTLITDCSVVVDALLGTGQNSAPRGAVGDMLIEVQRARASGADLARVVAVDLPTGVNADTGEVYPGAVNADLTVAIELIKRGMLQYPARTVCGDIWVVKIGLICDACEFSLLDPASLKAFEPRRTESHKGDFGSVMVVGGSENMPGAPILSAIAALRCGVGSVIKVHLRGTGLPGSLPELMLLSVGENDRFFSQSHLAPIKVALDGIDAVVFGPGIGTQPATEEFVPELIELVLDAGSGLVIDADALNCLARLKKAGHSIECPGSVLTPHPGEMARLLDISVEQVQANRYQAALTLAQVTQATVVLKGAATVIVSGCHGWVNTTGNPWLAVPGSGDVLAGLIAGFIAQGFSPLEAAKSAVMIHGRAGELLEQKGVVPFLASTIIEAAAQLIGEGSLSQ